MKRKSVIYKRTVFKLKDFPTATKEGRRQQNGTLNVLREDKCQNILLYAAKLSFKHEVKIKQFLTEKTESFYYGKPLFEDLENALQDEG